MTRQYTDGAEMNDVLFWSATAGTTSASESPSPASGNFYYKTTGNSQHATKNNDAISEAYWRFRIALSHVTSTSIKFPEIRTGTTLIADLRINTGTTRIDATVNGAVIGSTTTTITPGVWYLIEIYYKMADSTAGRFYVKVDGNLEISYDGDTKPGAPTTFDNIRFFSATGMDVCTDDIAMNDTNGSVDNGWCGDGRIVKITPVGDGSVNDWSALSGSSKYAMCDEYPNDGDTSFIFTNGSVTGTTQQFIMDDSFVASGSIPKFVTRIWAEARAKKLSTDDYGLRLGELASGGSMVVSGSRSLLVTYSRIVGDESFVNPVTGTAWTESDIGDLILVAQT